MKECVDNEQLLNVLNQLRIEKSDNQYYEVKRAVGGFPESSVETLCAFANTPGGGILIFGVDESLDFEIVGVYDSKACQQALASHAKTGFTAPIGLSTKLLVFGEKKVIWAEITEADRMLKPIKTKKGNRAFVRLYDGDFELSAQEEQMFVSARGQSHFDEDAVEGTSVTELNGELATGFIKNRKRLSATLAKMSDEEVLLRSGVSTKSGALTKAGLLALGIYPQQFLPNYAIKASVQKRAKQTGKVRATNVRSFDGPIPTMLDEAVKWVSENSEELVLDLPNGHVRSVHEYPSIVMRELIANALIHRDLSPISMIQTITLTIEDDRLLISNPGGLYGLHLNELGRTGSVTRNSRIADICQYVIAADGVNVIERLGSGIPKVLEELSELDMPSPKFIDGGIYFTVILNGILSKTADTGVVTTPASNERLTLAVLAGGPKSKAEIQRATGFTYGQTKYAVEKLLKGKKIYKIGKNRAPNTRYAMVADDE